MNSDSVLMLLVVAMIGYLCYNMYQPQSADINVFCGEMGEGMKNSPMSLSNANWAKTPNVLNSSSVHANSYNHPVDRKISASAHWESKASNVGDFPYAESRPNGNSKELLTEDLIPRPSKNQPSWAEKFSRAENLVMQENFINGSTEGFMTNELPCTKRFMNLDLRKSPVVQIQQGLSPWNLTVAHPSCAAQDQSRPPLDDNA